MTALLLVVGVVLVSGTAWLIARAVALPRARFALHLKQIEHYGFQTDAGELDVTVVPEERHGPANAVVEALGRVTASVAPWLRPLERRELYAAAMYTVSPEAVHGFRFVCATLLFGLIVLSGPPPTLTWSVVLIG